jgi:hypothetical protein
MYRRRIVGRARSRFWLLVATVVLVATLVYAPTWAYDFTHLDDDTLILDQQAFLQQPSSLLAVFGRSYFGGSSTSYYRPLINASLVLDALWSGPRPFGYHFTNVLLHATASALLFALGRRLGWAISRPGGARRFSPCIPCTARAWRGSRGETT